MCYDCATLKFCCKRTCNCSNAYFYVPMWIIGFTSIVIVGYFIIIGYGCLWDQYVWNNVFGHNSSCTPFNPDKFFAWDIISGVGALLTTAAALALVAAGLFLFGSGIYGLYKLITGCCRCCTENYEAAQVDAKAHKATEKAPLLPVNVDVK